MRQHGSTNLLVNAGATVPTRSRAIRLLAERPYSFDAQGVLASGTGSAVIIIQVSNDDAPSSSDDVGWLEAGRLLEGKTLGTTRVDDAVYYDEGELPYKWVRHKLESASGDTPVINSRLTG